MKATRTTDTHKITYKLTSETMEGFIASAGWTVVNSFADMTNNEKDMLTYLQCKPNIRIPNDTAKFLSKLEICRVSL